jgi:cytochrome c1
LLLHNVFGGGLCPFLGETLQAGAVVADQVCQQCKNENSVEYASQSDVLARFDFASGLNFRTT